MVRMGHRLKLFSCVLRGVTVAHSESVDAQSCGQQIPSGLTPPSARPSQSVSQLPLTLSCALPANWLIRGQATSGPKARGWHEMAEPERPQLSPYQVQLEAGKRYAWCRCGRSKKQPFCDGSHNGTGIEPLMFTAERNELALLCGCKDTGDPPYCDGSHMLL
jgi:CDGSH-type Zn-finger protein